MLARSIVCAIFVLGATPAAAGEGASYAPVPDALALLQLDSNATFETPRRPGIVDVPELRDYDVRGSITPGPLRTGLAAFDRMRVAPEVDTPFVVTASVPGGRDLLGGWSLAATGATIRGEGGREAVREAMTRRFRAPRALDGRIVMKIDGNVDSPVWSIGGGIPAVLWSALPEE